MPRCTEITQPKTRKAATADSESNSELPLRKGATCDRAMLVQLVFALILTCLMVNGLLVICNLADSRAFAERLGAVFCGACGALINELAQKRKN